jgi:MoaA/NifB/PqqE/SkfB family radical SAM enzyme
MTQVITHSILKLVQHPEICKGNIHPISAQLDLTTSCNLDCTFCTARNDRKKPKNVDMKKFEETLDGLKELGCKGIEITGGGEPLMHKDFEGIILLIKKKGFDIGLVTNGALISKKKEDIWDNFDWIRVSVNAGPSMYKQIHNRDVFNNVLEGLKTLDRRKVFYGVSYVYTGQPYSDLIELKNIIGSTLKNISYLRVAKDVLKDNKDFDKLKAVVSAEISNNHLFVDYQVDRDMWIPEKCVMYKLKPRIDINNDVYPCCISQYRGQNRLGTFDEYKKAMKEKKEMKVDTKLCPYCIYGETNNFALKAENTVIKNRNFI